MLKAIRQVRRLADRLRVLRPRDLALRGISANWLRILDRDEVERVGPGLYVEHGRQTDPVLLVARKYPSLTLAMTSALWLSKVLDRRPPEDWWILGAGDRMPSWAPQATRYLRSRRAQADRFRLLVEQVPVAMHLPLHATLDCVRFRHVVGDDQMLAAIRAGLASGVFSLVELLAHARTSRLWEAVLDALHRLGFNLDTMPATGQGLG